MGEFVELKTDVVLLPGLHGSTALYDSFVALAPPWARCRPVALPAVGEQTFEGLSGALEPELRPLEGFVLVAESFSGPIAARLAAKLGRKVGLLVLCNPLVEMRLGVPTGFAARLVSSRFTPLWGVAAALSGGDRVLARHALREARLLPKRTLEERLAAAFSASVDDLSRHLVAPLLGILGTRDRLVSPSRTEGLLERIPGATIIEVDAPHLVVQTRPADVWAAITDEFESAA